MAGVFFSGFETGDFGEWSGSSGTTNGTATVDTALVRPGGGKYSYKVTTTASTQPSVFQGSPSFTAATTFIIRSAFYLDSIAANITFANSAELLIADSAGAQVACVGVQSDSSGNPSLWILNNITSAQVGSAFAITTGRWYRLECKVVISATVGILELKVDGNVAITGSLLNTGSSGITHVFVGVANTAAVIGAVTCHFDDLYCDNATYPGDGVGLLFPIKAGTPTFNTWTKSNSSTIDTVWNTVPFNTTTNATSSTSAQKQTGLINTTANGGTTPIGTDIINALKVAWFGKTASTTTADSSIFLSASFTEVDTVSTVYTTSDVYHEALLATAPTMAQFLNVPEAGLKHAANSILHTVEDLWVIADITFVRYAVQILYRSHRLKNPPKPKFVKSSQPHIPKGSVQISADALGIWPHLLSSRVQHTIKPPPKWRSVKSTFRRWSFIQPPAAKLGAWPHLLSSRIQRRLKLSKSKLRQDEQDIPRRAVGPVAIVARIIQHRRRLLRTRLPAKYRQDEQDVSRRAVAPTAIVFMRRLRGKLTKRTKRASRLEVTAISGRPTATGLRPFVRRAKAITIVSRRKIRRSRLIATAPVAFRRVVAHLKAQPQKLRARLHLRTPIKLIQPPAAALGFSVTRIKSSHRTKAPNTLKARRGSQNVQRRGAAPGAMIRRARRLAIRVVARRPASRQRLHMPATVIFAMLFLRRLRRTAPKLRSPKHKLGEAPLSGRPAVAGFRPFARRTKATIVITRRKVRRRLQTPLKLIQPPAAALGAALREIVHKARPVQLSKPWRIVKSTFKKIWLAQPPAARLGFPPSKLADHHRLVLRPSSKLVKSVMRSPRRQIQPSAAALGMAVRSLVHKAHPVKLGKAWKTVKSSFKLGELQKPAAAALLAFVPTKLRKAHRLVLLKSSKLVKDTLHIPRALIQPPAAKLGVALRNIIRKPRPLSFSRPFRLVKMRMRAPRNVIQPPAAKLGVWPHLLSSRVQHRVKPSLRWRIVKSAFKRWSFIQPPAARLGVAVRKLIPKAKLRALPKPWRTVKSLFKRPDKIIPPPIVAGANAFVPKVHSSKLRAKTATRTARRRLRLAAPAAFIRLRAIRRIRRVATQQQRPVRRRLHFSASLAFIRLHAIRKIRQLPARQVRQRLSARIAQAPAALFRLRHMHAARTAQRPTAAKAHRRIFSGPSSFIHFMRTHRRRPTARKPRLLRRSPRIGVLLGVPTVASLLAFLRARPHGPRAPFRPFKWLRIPRWLRQWRFSSPPPPSAALPRVIFNARLDPVVEFAATLNRDPVMTDTSNQMITIDARL